jgi:hypothetical protein
MDLRHLNAMAQIRSEMTCPWDSQCYTSGFCDLTRDDGHNRHPTLKCIRPETKSCEYRASVGDARYCICPLLTYAYHHIK